MAQDEAAAAYRIRAIEMFTLSHVMFANTNTLSSLQIIQSELHPNSHMQGPDKSTFNAKESLSVYGLFHRFARTPQGRQRLRQMFLRPSLDINVIEERLNSIRIFLRPENLTAFQSLAKSLKKIKNIRTVVIHLQKGISNPSRNASSIQRGVWASILHFTFHAKNIVEAASQLEKGDRLTIVNKVSPRYLLHVIADD
jgi:DNA mismatch repair protein MSH5